jgi:hypothetical protein
VRYGKTIKSTTKALPLEAKYRKCLIDKPACFGQIEAVVKNCMATGDINEKYFACVGAGNVGELLRGLRGEGVEVTTRCFRKHFAARAYAESDGDAIATSENLTKRWEEMYEAERVSTGLPKEEYTHKRWAKQVADLPEMECCMEPWTRSSQRSSSCRLCSSPWRWWRGASSSPCPRPRP